jgi:hypothetical protein
MSLTLEELYKIKKSLEELSADVETFNWGPSWEFANQRKAEALKLLRREIKIMKHESPYEIGKRLYKTGFGISDLWGAVENDEELAEAQRGYDDAEAKDRARQDLKEIRSKLGYSRIGRNNV